jgi:hypothetical protein
MFLENIVYDQPKKYALCIEIRAQVMTIKVIASHVEHIS